MYNQAINNKVVYPLYARVNVREKPAINAQLIKEFLQNQVVGRTTGTELKMKDGSWYQVLFSEKVNGKEYGYVKANSIKLVEGKNDIEPGMVQKMIDSLISNDLAIFKSLGKSAAILNDLKAKGKNTKAFENTLTDLKFRHDVRQNKIRTSKLLSWKEATDEFVKKTTEFLVKYTPSRTYYGMYGIGAAQGVAIVVGAVVGVGLATAVYFAFRPDYDESKTDLKISSELEQALSKVSPETAEKIKTDLETQIDTAYNSGKTAGTFSGMWNVLKPLAIGFGGFLLIKSFINSQNKNNGKK